LKAGVSYQISFQTRKDVNTNTKVVVYVDGVAYVTIPTTDPNDVWYYPVFNFTATSPTASLGIRVIAEVLNSLSASNFFDDFKISTPDCVT